MVRFANVLRSARTASGLTQLVLAERSGIARPNIAAYEHGRREEVEKTQHAADVSLVWFEHVDRFWDFDPVQFAFGVMTRAKAITYDNLMLRAPDFVREVGKLVRVVRQCETLVRLLGLGWRCRPIEPKDILRHSLHPKLR